MFGDMLPIVKRFAVIAPKMHPTTYGFQQAPPVMRHRRSPNDAITGLAIDLFRILPERTSSLAVTD